MSTLMDPYRRERFERQARDMKAETSERMAMTCNSDSFDTSGKEKTITSASRREQTLVPVMTFKLIVSFEAAPP